MLQAVKDARIRCLCDVEPSDWKASAQKLLFGRESFEVLSPEDYLICAAEGVKLKNIVVDGDVRITQKTRGVAKIKVLPQAFIRGCLTVEGSRHLELSECHVLGSSKIKDCPNLGQIKGVHFSDAEFENSGITGLGADFRCGWNLKVKKCGLLKVVNCEVGGGLEIRDSAFFRTGPAFHCQQSMVVTDCPNLFELVGRVERQLFLQPPTPEDSNPSIVFAQEVHLERLKADGVVADKQFWICVGPSGTQLSAKQTPLAKPAVGRGTNHRSRTAARHI